MRMLLVVAVVPMMAADWPQWRGPGSSGISAEPGIAAAWSPEKNIAWKTELPGRGNSQPVVWGDRIFLTAEVAGDVIAGAKAPVHLLEGQVFVHPDSTGSERKHKMLVIALDRATGKIVWERTAYEGGCMTIATRKAATRVRRR